MVDDIQVTWTISTFDRRLKGPFPLPTKHYVLDWTKASESEQAEIVQMLGLRDQPDRQPLQEGEVIEQFCVGPAPADERMLRFRHLFVEKPIKELASKSVRVFRGINLQRKYFEDEAGCEITMREMFQIAAGNKNVIPFDAENIAQLGACGIRAGETWTVEKANVLFNFIQVVRLIAASRWARKKTTMTAHGFTDNGHHKLECDFPDVDSVCAVMTLFRQLYAKRDKVLEEACKVYIEHCGDDLKKSWVNYCLQNFNRNLDEPPFFNKMQGCTVRQLFEAFLYGTGVVHSIGPKTKDNLKELSDLVRQHGREKVILAVHESFWMTVKYAFDVYRVIEQDYAYWIETEGFAKADMFDIFTLLGSTE